MNKVITARGDAKLDSIDRLKATLRRRKMEMRCLLGTVLALEVVILLKLFVH